MGTVGLNELGQEIRDINLTNGWDTHLDSMTDIMANLMLIVTEVAEAAEEVRKGDISESFYIEGDEVVRGQGLYSHLWLTLDNEGSYSIDAIPKTAGLPSELADIIIRALDTVALLGIDIDGALERKLAYNRTRTFRHGGKTL